MTTSRRRMSGPKDEVLNGLGSDVDMRRTQFVVGTQAYAVMFLMSLCRFVPTADFTAAGVAMPSIFHSFPSKAALLPWVISTSELTLSGFVLLGGRLGDSLGQRKGLQFSLLGYCVALIVCATAPNAFALIIGRALQGLAAAVFVPTSFSLINTLIEPGVLRHRALGVFSVMQGAASIMGLVVGGIVTTSLGWRAAFLINVPVLVVALSMIWKFVPHRETPASPVRDVPGAIYICASTGLLLWSLQTLGRAHGGSGSGWIFAWAALVAALTGYAIFALRELRVRDPLVPKEIVDRNLLGGCFGGLGLQAGVVGIFLLANLYMQRELHFSAALSGLGMIPASLAVIASGQLTPIALGRWSGRNVAIGGVAVNLVGILLFALLAPSAHYTSAILVGALIAPLGSGLSLMGLMGQATRPVPPAHQGTVSGILFTFQHTGVAVGSMAVLTVVETGTAAIQGLSTQSFMAGYLACAVLAGLGGLAMWGGLRSLPNERVAGRGA